MRFVWILALVVVTAMLLSSVFVVNENDVRNSAKIRANFDRVQVSQDSPEANEIFLSRGLSGIFYMGWNDYRSVSWSNGYVHLGFSYSTDGGNTWSQNQVLDNDSDNDFHDAAGDPVVVGGDGDDVYYVMMEFNTTEAKQNNFAHSQLVVKKSTDHGQTWSDEARIWPYDVDKPWASFWNRNLYVVWDNMSTYQTEFSRTTDGTIHSWSSKIEIPGYNEYPGIALNDSGAIFIATNHYNNSDSSWDQLAVSISTDGGLSFSQVIVGNVGPNSWEDNPRSYPIPQIAAQGENVYAVWVSNESYSQIYLGESHDGGSTWSTKEVGDLTGSEYRYMYPSVSVSPNGMVHLEYYRMVNSNKEISVIYRNYTYETGKFSSEKIIDSWTNSHSFIGDYATIVADRFGNVSIGYTTENPGDNAMFSTMPLPLKIEDVKNSSKNGTLNYGETLNVTSNISSYTEVQNVLLYYRFENETQYNFTTMTLVNGDVYNGTWRASIDTSNHTGKLYFYVYADDGLQKSDKSEEEWVNIGEPVPELWIPLIVIVPAIIAIFRRKR